MSAARLWAAAVAVRAGATYGRDVDNPHRIVILGAGTGGTLTANRLQRLYGDASRSWSSIATTATSTSRACCSCPFGLADPDEIVRSRRAQLHDGIEFRLAEVDRVETAGDTVHLAGGDEHRLRRARRRVGRARCCPRRPRG